MLGIPTVRDRLVHQAIHQALNRYYDPHFSGNSYGFRPGRDAHQAILQASQYIKEGREWVVDIDLEKFFDGINHDRLMQRLSKGVGDKRLLRLIKAYLKAGIMEDGLVEQRIAGAPQGGPLSPLLSNIVLDELDEELVIVGWSNYFSLADRWLSNIRDLDGWIRRKLRCYRLKQCGKKYTIYKFLRSMGIPERKSWNVVMYSQGWWNMSTKLAVSQSMNFKWFALQGLHSLYLRLQV